MANETESLDAMVAGVCIAMSVDDGGQLASKQEEIRKLRTNIKYSERAVRIAERLK